MPLPKTVRAIQEASARNAGEREPIEGEVVREDQPQPEQAPSKISPAFRETETKPMTEQAASETMAQALHEDTAFAEAAADADRAKAAMVPARPRAASAVSHVSGGAATPVDRVLEESGFEGLDLGFGFGAFSTVTLKDDTFRVDDASLGSEFLCIVHGTKAKFIYKPDRKSDVFKYSHDKVHATNGALLSDVFAEWVADGDMEPGAEPFCKPYLDVTAQLIDSDTGESGKVVLLQIPETSIDRLKGYLQTVVLGGRVPNQVVTRVHLGPKVTSVKHPFWPWAFSKHANL